MEILGMLTNNVVAILAANTKDSVMQIKLLSELQYTPPTCETEV
jgi:hypothetical protein